MKKNKLIRLISLTSACGALAIGMPLAMSSCSCSEDGGNTPPGPTPPTPTSVDFRADYQGITQLGGQITIQDQWHATINMPSNNAGQMTSSFMFLPQYYDGGQGINVTTSQINGFSGTNDVSGKLEVQRNPATGSSIRINNAQNVPPYGTGNIPDFHIHADLNGKTGEFYINITCYAI